MGPGAPAMVRLSERQKWKEGGGAGWTKGRGQRARQLVPGAEPRCLGPLLGGALLSKGAGLLRLPGGSGVRLARRRSRNW